MTLEADVLVLGAGPAGAALALNLARFHRVLVIERAATARRRIGESLIPAARRLLTDLGLWDAFLQDGHLPAQAQRSCWGSEEVTETDALRDPDGPGWHLDRLRFDDWLRAEAQTRGAARLNHTTFLGASRDHLGWRIRLQREGRELAVRARLFVDAGGRAAPGASGLGAHRVTRDRLVGAWLHGTEASPADAGVTWVEAEAEGWWYSAPLPQGGRVIAFHTDADLPPVRELRVPGGLLARARRQPQLGALLERAGFTPDPEEPLTGPGLVMANSSELTPATGPDWLAVGDAAQAFDPLASQGIFHALYTGLIGAEAAHRHLQGDAGALPGYEQRLVPVRQAYHQHLRAWYALEQRWLEQPFWKRRHPVPPLNPAETNPSATEAVHLSPWQGAVGT